MHVTFATTWESKCNLAEYSHSLVNELRKHIGADVVSLDPKAITTPAFVAARLNDGEVAHIQHQYSLFGGMAIHRNWFRRATRRLDVPAVVTIHDLDLGAGSIWPVRLYKKWFNRYLFGGAEIDRVIVHSRTYCKKLIRMGIEPELLRVVPMWVPAVNPADVGPDSAKAEFGFMGKRVLGIFGSVVPRRGYGIALEALRRLPNDVCLLIAGGAGLADRGDFFKRIKAHIEQTGLSDRVRITGHLPSHRMPLAMQATDVVVAPYTSAGGPWTLMRAIAYRKAVVASDLHTIREINERQPCLTLFESGNARALAAKVSELLEHEGELVRAVEASDSYAHLRPASVAAAETMAVYRELIG